MKELKVAEVFSPDLGGRYRSEGPWSGEVFRKTQLIDRVDKALRENEVLLINFDGVEGTPTSFLEEAFGGLLRAKPEWTFDQLKRVLRLEAPNTPLLHPLMMLAYQYMERAEERRRTH